MPLPEHILKDNRRKNLLKELESSVKREEFLINRLLKAIEKENENLKLHNEELIQAVNKKEQIKIRIIELEKEINIKL